MKPIRHPGRPGHRAQILSADGQLRPVPGSSARSVGFLCRGAALRRVLAIVGMLGAVTLILAVLLSWGFFYNGFLRSHFDDQRFDRAKWTAPASVNSDRTPRGRMAGDLRRRFLRRGMSRSEVRALLGRPDDEERGVEDHYLLGYCSPMSIDGDQLIIRYDRSGQLAATKIYEH